MQKIQIKNINLGGIADSNYMGGASSVADMVGLDIHSEVGIIKVNQALTKESGATVDDFVKAGVTCSDGNSYLFGSTLGKVWKRTSTGTYSLEATVAPAVGALGILEAKEYQGYIYYATQNRLGRWQIGTAWSTRNDNWGTFTNGDADWHPMIEINLVLYIGDKNLVAQVDAGVFSADALDLPFPTETRIKCLGEMGTDILIGTYINSYIVKTKIYRWNTWSVSFTNSDWIPEVGINAFIQTDNFVIVNAGTKGNLYLYDGSTLEPYKQIKGNWTGTTNKAQVHPNATLNFNGLPLFGFSNISGNPSTLGVYSLGRANRNYPYVLNCEQGLSNGHLSNVEIGAIMGVGDIYLVTWKDTTTGTVYGVDKLDLTLKYPSAYLTTRVIMVDRIQLLTYKTIDVAYRLLPALTGFTLSAKVNNGTMTAVSSGEVTDDTQRNILSSDIDINDATTLQVKVAFNTSVNLAPEVELIEISV